MSIVKPEYIPIREVEQVFLCKGFLVAYTGGRYGDSAENPLWGGDSGRQIGKIISLKPLRDQRIIIYVEWKNELKNDYMLDQLSYVHTGKLPDGRIVAVCLIPLSINNTIIDKGFYKTEATLKLDEGRLKGVFNL